MTEAKKRENFIILPYKMLKPRCGSSVSALGALILGQIFSYAKDEKACVYGYKNFTERLHVSRSTVARQVSEIIKRDDVTAQRRGGKPTTYTTTFELDGAYLDVPLWITSSFEVTYWTKGSKEVTETVTLTPSEQLVLAMIYTETKCLDKKGKKAYRASPATISKALQSVVCSRTVKSALLRLEKFNLIERLKVSTNAHGEGLGYYKAKLSKFREILAKRRRVEKRAQKKLEAAERALEEFKTKQTAKTQQEKAIEDANARADRKRFYSLKSNAAEAKAEKYKLEAYKLAPKLKEIDVALAKCEIDVARAEIFEPSKLAEAVERKRRLEAERAAILSRYGLKAELFERIGWISCKKCSDTGSRSDGTSCDCWKM